MRTRLTRLLAAMAATLPLLLLPGQAAAITEFGTNDFRISTAGVDGDTSAKARDPEVAYAPNRHQYLAVWRADTDGDFFHEIYGQRMGAVTGAPLGPVLEIGPTGVGRPAVAYNETDGTYLVVWSQGGHLAGQLLSAFDGTKLGGIREFAEEHEPLAAVPEVLWNPQRNDFFVVWAGDTVIPCCQSIYQMYGLHLDGTTLAEIGAPVQISDTNSSGNGFDGFDSGHPRAAYNGVSQEYLVVWWGQSSPPLGPDEEEIFGRRVDFDGNVLDPMDVRISDMGFSSSTTFGAKDPDVAFNPTTNEYLVVWEGCDSNCQSSNPRNQIWGQRIAGGTSLAVGTNDFPISFSHSIYLKDSENPRVAYAPNRDEWLVVWDGDPASNGLAFFENEIFGQRLDASGAEVGEDDFRLSDMGPDGDPDYDAFEPSLALIPATGEALVVWVGDDTLPGLDENEIFGQLFRVDVTPPNCGNGELEEGEECESPFSACCNATTCQIEEAGVICRGAADPCDASEFCDGASAECPVDESLPDGFACDDGDVCITGDTCQSGVCEGTTCGSVCGDGVLEFDEQCEAPFGACCNEATCQFWPSDVECRPAFGSCDAPEHCSGSSGSCPFDGFVDNGASCDDGDACPLDVCQQGTCTPGACGPFVNLWLSPRFGPLKLKIKRDEAVVIEPKVRLGYLAPGVDPRTIHVRVDVVGTSCPEFTVSDPDFDPDTPGIQNTTFLDPMGHLEATIRFKAEPEKFSSPSRASMDRCSVMIQATPDGAMDVDGPPSILHFDVSVFDGTDPETETEGDAYLLGLPSPLVDIGRRLEARKTFNVTIGNADPRGSGSDLLELSEVEIDCARSVVERIDCDRQEEGDQNQVLVPGGKKAKCSVTLLAFAEDFDSTQRLPDSCHFALQVLGPGTDPQPRNNVARTRLYVRGDTRLTCPGGVCPPRCGNGTFETGEQCEAPFGPCCNQTTCQLEPPTTACRAQDGVCDVTEYCSGTSDQCPVNSFVPDDTACDDGDSCLLDTCQSGMCVSSSCDAPVNLSLISVGSDGKRSVTLRREEAMVVDTRLKVTNLSEGPQPVRVEVTSSSCPAFVVREPDFDPETPGAQNRVTLDPFEDRRFVVPAEVRPEDFTTRNAKSFDRCTFAVQAIPEAGIEVSNPPATAWIELTVLDRTDPELDATGDIYLKQVRGTLVRFDGQPNGSSRLQFQVGNAGLRGTGEDLVQLTPFNVSCPPSVQAVIDCAPRLEGDQAETAVPRGRQKTCSATFSAQADEFFETPGLVDFCFFGIRAEGPGADPQSNNNESIFKLSARR